MIPSIESLISKYKKLDDLIHLLSEHFILIRSGRREVFLVSSSYLLCTVLLEERASLLNCINTFRCGDRYKLIMVVIVSGAMLSHDS